ncbi:MAG TPA: type II secretion system protein GspM [Casimicrobiaceae bacterium]|nr:type II secretion system protein GspM [Casimicrobiaceae bacterium]
MRNIEDAFAARRGFWFPLAIAVGVIVALLVALRLSDAIDRAHDEVLRNRLAFDVARARLADSASLARENPQTKAGDVRGAIERALNARGLRYSRVDAQAGDGTERVIIDAAAFATLVRAIDDLSRGDGVRVVDATLTARVDPGTVRAELAFAR